MKKYIEIDGVNFEFKKGLTIKKDWELKTLDFCYNKPSAIKEDIMKYWVDFARKHNCGAYYGVAGYNCMMFTFDAMIEYEGKQYYLHITPKYNYIMEMGEEEVISYEDFQDNEIYNFQAEKEVL